MLEVCLHPYVGHLHLLDMRTRQCLLFLCGWLCHTAEAIGTRELVFSQWGGETLSGLHY